MVSEYIYLLSSLELYEYTRVDFGRNNNSSSSTDPLAFATLPHGCTGNPHDRDSGPTGNPHDRSSATPSGFEIGNPHDSFRHPFHELHGFPSGDICPGS